MSECFSTPTIPAGTRVYCKITQFEASRLNVQLVDNPAFDDIEPELFLLSAGAILSAVVDGSSICGDDVKVRLRVDEENFKADLFNGELVPFVTSPVEFSPGTACGDDTYLEWLAYDRLSGSCLPTDKVVDEADMTATNAAAETPAETIDLLEAFPGDEKGVALHLNSEGGLGYTLLKSEDDIRGHAAAVVVWLDKNMSESTRKVLSAAIPMRSRAIKVECIVIVPARDT